MKYRIKENVKNIGDRNYRIQVKVWWLPFWVYPITVWSYGDIFNLEEATKMLYILQSHDTLGFRYHHVTGKFRGNQ